MGGYLMSFVWWQHWDPWGAERVTSRCVSAFWVTDFFGKTIKLQWKDLRRGIDKMRWCESEFHLISLFSFPLHHLFTSIYASRPDWNLPRCIGHVCVGITHPNFERGVCALKPPGREVIRKFEREREGWQTLWCAEIDNIKGIARKKHTHFFWPQCTLRVGTTTWMNMKQMVADPRMVLGYELLICLWKNEEFNSAGQI